MMGTNLKMAETPGELKNLYRPRSAVSGNVSEKSRRRLGLWSRSKKKKERHQRKVEVGELKQWVMCWVTMAAFSVTARIFAHSNCNEDGNTPRVQELSH